MWHNGWDLIMVKMQTWCLELKNVLNNDLEQLK